MWLHPGIDGIRDLAAGTLPTLSVQSDPTFAGSSIMIHFIVTPEASTQVVLPCDDTFWKFMQAVALDVQHTLDWLSVFRMSVFQMLCAYAWSSSTKLKK